MERNKLDYILYCATYEGPGEYDAAYNSYEELEDDYKSLSQIALSPLEVAKIIEFAYELGKLEGGQK